MVISATTKPGMLMVLEVVRGYDVDCDIMMTL